MTEWETVDSLDAVRGLAPEAFAAFDAMRAAASRIDSDSAAGAARAATVYAAQFNIDVASLTDEQRRAAADELGEDLFGFLQATWVTDMADRVDHALGALVGIDPEESRRRVPLTTVARAAASPDPAGALWESIDAFLPAVARLAALDPVTTEVVRLRGARAHDCRLCRSLRSVGAIDAGADEATFDAIDRYEESDLDPGLKVALRLVDAVIWEPRSWPVGLAAQVRDRFSPAAAVEIVLDVVRNGANKIAVALGADQPNVAEGVEYFAMDDSGTLTYGLDAPGRTPTIAESIAASYDAVHVPVTYEHCDHVDGPFFHGTRTAFEVGDLISPGRRSNYHEHRLSNHVYFAALLEPAVWAAELAVALAGVDERGYIYVVEPTGPFEDDPNVTDKRFPGNVTRSYRTRHPMRVVAETEAWEGHAPEALQGMLDNLTRLRAQGLDLIED